MTVETCGVKGTRCHVHDLSFVTQLVVMLKDVYTVVTREGHG